MAEAALNELQQQIEAIRREAFAEGHAAAMKAVGAAVRGRAPDSSTGPERTCCLPRLTLIAAWRSRAPM